MIKGGKRQFIGINNSDIFFLQNNTPSFSPKSNIPTSYINSQNNNKPVILKSDSMNYKKNNLNKVSQLEIQNSDSNNKDNIDLIRIKKTFNKNGINIFNIKRNFSFDKNNSMSIDTNYIDLRSPNFKRTKDELADKGIIVSPRNTNYSLKRGDILPADITGLDINQLSKLKIQKSNSLVDNNKSHKARYLISSNGFSDTKYKNITREQAKSKK